jgi:WD40 repeat protein
MNSKTLICNFVDCGLILEDPITLLCGNNLCKHHLDQTKNKFKCSFCHKMHTIPDTGFVVNNPFNELIKSYVRSDPIRNDLKKSFDKLNQSITDYENLYSHVYISDYFYALQDKVNLHQDELINDIREKSNEIIKQLKEKEKKCKSNNVKIEKMNFYELKNDVMTECKHKLRIPELNQIEINELMRKMSKVNEDIQNQLEIYKNDLLLGESIEFMTYEKSSLVGKLVINSKFNSLTTECGKLIRSFNHHSGCVRSIQADEKSNKIISASCDNTLKICDLESGECLKTIHDHKSWVTAILLIQNDIFISGSWDKTIKIWDLNSYDCLNTLTNQSPVYSLCLISNSKIACGCQDGSINIWNLADFKRCKSFKAHNDWIPFLLLIDNLNLISCSGVKDKKIKIWNLETFKCKRELEGHSDAIYYLDPTSNGNLLSCSFDRTIKLWNMKTGELLKSIQFEYPIYHVKMLCEDLIAIGLGSKSKGEIIVYNLNKMFNVKIIAAHSSNVHSLNFLSNGDLLSGSLKGDIKLWKNIDKKY